MKVSNCCGVGVTEDESNDGFGRCKKCKVYKYRSEGVKYDLVRIYYPTPEELISNFDFTIACCACDKERIYHHSTYFIDLAKRKLVINKLPYPVSTLRRLQKYILKGFTICNGGIVELTKALSGVPVEQIDENKLYVD